MKLLGYNITRDDPVMQPPGKAAESQMRDSWDDPFKRQLGNYIDLRGDLKLYDAMRATLPILDVAVSKRANLLGDFEIEADDRVKQYIEWFLKTVRVGWTGRGYNSWLRQMIDSAIAKGFAVGELVPDILMSGVDRLKVGRANEFRFTKNEQTGRLDLCQVMDENIMPIKLENQDLIHYLAFDLRDGHPQGVSMFASMPFIAEIVARINKATDNMIWRVGDPTFMGIYKAGERDTKETVEANVTAFTDELSGVMKSRRIGKVRDLCFGVSYGGDFKVDILGGNTRTMDISIPLKSCMEQIIARTGLPPYMFGLSWSTTERMSKEQSDMLVAEIESQRSILDATIEKTLTTALILGGMAGAKWGHNWNEVNLMDEVSQSQAALNTAQSVNTEVTAMMQLYNAGMDTSEAMIDLAVRAGWIEEGTTFAAKPREQMVEEIRAHTETMRKMALVRLSVE